MSLIRWEPRGEQLRPWNWIERDLNEMFDNSFNGWLLPWRGAQSAAAEFGFVPSVDLQETDTAYLLSAEVPGVEAKQLDVKIKDGVVTIAGERTSEQAESKGSFHRRETCYGAFSRSIELPGEVDSDKVSAQLKDGVLTLELPKRADPTPQGKKIDVKSA